MLTQYDDQPIVTTKTLDTPAPATAAVVTIAAVTGLRTVIDKIFLSYGALPTGGRLTITDGGATVVDFDIGAAGPGPQLGRMSFAVNSAVVVTLASGGGVVVGKLNVHHYKVGSAPGVALS
jgi:hypothetical protein